MRDNKKILFVRFPRQSEKSHPYEKILPISLCLAATILKENNYMVTVKDFFLKEERLYEFFKYLNQIEIDIVFLQYESPSVSIINDFVRRIKEINDAAVVIAFGSYAYSAPIYILKNSFIDICVTSDIEFVALDLVKAVISNNVKDVPNVVFRDIQGEIIENYKKEYFDIDTLPYIDLSLIRKGDYFRKKYPYYPGYGKYWGFIRTSYGCPYKCSFCSLLLRNSLSEKYKEHSVQYVLENVRYYKHKHNIRLFSFEDDSFGINKARTIELCSALKKENVKWVVEGIRADCIDEDIIKAMSEAGCYGIGMGVESGSNKILNILNKKETVEDIIKAAMIIKKYKMLLVATVMIGNPDETIDDLNKTKELIKIIKPHILYIHYFTLYPDTEFFGANNMQYAAHDINHYKYNGVNVSCINHQLLKRSMKDFYKEYYFSLAYIKEYVFGRLKYSLFSIKEWRLIFEAFSFLNKKE